MATQWKGWKLEGLPKLAKTSTAAQGTRRVLVSRARAQVAALAQLRDYGKLNPRNAAFVARREAEIERLSQALEVAAAVTDPEWFLERREAVKRDPLAALLTVEAQRKAA